MSQSQSKTTIIIKKCVNSERSLAKGNFEVDRRKVLRKGHVIIVRNNTTIRKIVSSKVVMSKKNKQYNKKGGKPLALVCYESNLIDVPLIHCGSLLAFYSCY